MQLAFDSDLHWFDFVTRFVLDKMPTIEMTAVQVIYHMPHSRRCLRSRMTLLLQMQHR